MRQTTIFYCYIFVVWQNINKRINWLKLKNSKNKVQIIPILLGKLLACVFFNHDYLTKEKLLYHWFAWNIPPFAYICVWLHLSLHFGDLSVFCCFILFDIHTCMLVAMRIFASVNFGKSNFAFVFPNIVRYFLEMSLEILFVSGTFYTKFCEISHTISLQNSWEQRTEFVKICLHYFCTIYSGLQLIRTPKGHAIVSLLSGCPY